jgi:RNA polymerase sigma factor (sigma-70 family)
MDWIKNREWVGRLQAQDPVTQGRFFDGAWPEIYALCAGILGHNPDAVEVATDVLCDFVFERVGQLERPEALRAYLRLMATRRALRARDRRGAHEPLSESLVEEEGVTQEEKAMWAKINPRLRECLGRLGPKAQKVMYMRFSSELTNDRIGAAVGGSKQYIGRLIQKSLSILRACLERGLAGEPQ